MSVSVVQTPPSRRRVFQRALAVAFVSQGLLAGQSAFAQATSPCTGQPACMELRKFVATVTDFQSSKQGTTRMVTATVRFTNKGTTPLILGYVRESGIATDDQGNRFGVTGAIRGMGEINAREFDPKFVLQPGESSDARFELMWRPTTGREIYGTSYDLDLAVREINPIGTSQLTLGVEHALRFRRINDAVIAGTGSGGPVATAPVTVAQAPPADMPDPCGAKPRCFGAGPFTAEVVSLVPSMVGNRHHVLEITMRFKNVTNQPIILGYSSTTSGAVDNLGNRYYWGRAGTHDVSAKGIPILEARSLNPQFVLRPGESRNASFGVIRYNSGAQQLGTSFTYNVAIEQLRVLPSQQVQSVRQYALNFPSLTSGATVGDAVNALRGILKKK